MASLTLTPIELERDRVEGLAMIDRVVAVMRQDGADPGRQLIGNVATYLLQWALTGLPARRQEVALDAVKAHVLDLLDG